LTECNQCRLFHTTQCPAESPENVKLRMFSQNPDSKPFDSSCFEMANEEITISKVDEKGEIEYKGGIIPPFEIVYEPLGKGYYVWKCGKQKGLSEITVEEDKPSTLSIGPYNFNFKQVIKPEAQSFFETLPFKVPRLETVNQWIEEKRTSRDLEAISKDVSNYVKILLDLEAPYEYNLGQIWVIQTWLRRKLSFSWNLDFGGPFGAGKTAALMALVELAFHPYLGTPRASTLARLNGKYDLTWLIDEYDKAKRVEGKESLLDMIIRQGNYRGNLVTRWNYERGREETFDPFGPKIISYHTELETALKQRSLYHFKMPKSLDYRLPIVNTLSQLMSMKIFEDLFIWYMDNILSVNVQLLPQLPILPDKTVTPEEAIWLMINQTKQEPYPAVTINTSNSGNNGNESHDIIQSIRTKLYDAVTGDLSEQEKGLIKKLIGRTGQVAYFVIRLAKSVKLNGYIEDLDKALQLKQEEEEPEEYDSIQIVKDTIGKFIYVDKKTETNYTKLYKSARQIAKDEWGQVLTANAFGRALRDIGFRYQKNLVRRKSGKVRLLIFDELIRKNIPEPEKEEKTKEGVCVQCGQPCNRPVARLGYDGPIYLHEGECEKNWGGNL
jgi:hypothetical protein